MPASANPRSTSASCAGGSQRLVRAVGKALATQMVLTGEPISARRALEAGLVSETTQPELTVERAMAVAETIAAKAPLAVRLAREALHKAEDTDLATGLRFERHAFTLLAGRPRGGHSCLPGKTPRHLQRALTQDIDHE